MDERRSPWFDTGWPLLTGLVTAAGLVAAYVWMGLATTLIALALLELTYAPVAWSILTDVGYATRDVILRISPLWSVGSLAFVGLIDAMSAWGLLVGAVVLLTSPLLQGWRRVGTRGLVARHTHPQDETRRRFDEIVAHGFPGLPDDDLPPR
ncbi:MAG TPA: hypothetical protein VFJ89_13970 [Nocardioides sp.]|nr:hypothetical protein [Nocardioides sp.]